MTEPGQAPRDALVGRWLHLTRTVLPGMAAAQGWPIRLDHCFMRVFLDAAIGAPWHRTVPPPAIRNATDTQLTQAIALAERAVAEPGTLPPLNRASLDGRRAARRVR